MAMRRKLKHKRLIYALCLVDLIILIAAFGFVFHDYIGQLLAFWIGRRSPIAQDCFSRSWDKRCVLSIIADDNDCCNSGFFQFCRLHFQRCMFRTVHRIFDEPLRHFARKSVHVAVFYALRSAKTFSKARRVHCGNRTAQAKIYGILAGYMMPMFPSFIVNYVSVHLKLSVSTAISCIVIGMVPTSFIYAFGGNAIFEGAKPLRSGLWQDL